MRVKKIKLPAAEPEPSAEAEEVAPVDLEETADAAEEGTNKPFSSRVLEASGVSQDKDKKRKALMKQFKK